jgi:hypothetical protein
MAQSWALATGVASPSSQAQNVVAQRYQAMARYYAQTGQTSVLTGAVSDPGRYDGYKSSYPQLHQVPSGAVSDPGSTVDRAIAAYDRQADLEQTRREPAAFDWLDAGIGALVAFGAFSLLGLGALGLHTRAHRAARPAVL